MSTLHNRFCLELPFNRTGTSLIDVNIDKVKQRAVNVNIPRFGPCFLGILIYAICDGKKLPNHFWDKSVFTMSSLYILEPIYS